MKTKLTTAVFTALLMQSACAQTDTTRVEQNVKTWSVGLGVSRIVYHPGSRGVVVPVSNPNDYPVLVQSTFLPEGKGKAASVPFVVTPPLFRLDGHQQNNIRVVASRDTPVRDRETLYWFCATGIPPEQGDAWANGKPDESKNNATVLDIRIRARQCIKLLVRPDTVKGHPEEVASAVIWSRDGKTLRAQNPTPFYMNIRSLSVGNKPIANPEYLPPFGKKTYSLPATTGDDISWMLINDLGGDSGPYQATAR